MSAVQLARAEEVEQQAGAGPSPQQIVFGAGTAHIVSSCVQTALRLNVFEFIGSGIHKVSELAAKAKLNADALFRILRVLEMAGLVRQGTPKNFRLTEAGKLLLTDTPGSMRYIMQFMSDPFHFRVYSHLTESLVAGETPFERVHGEPYFQWVSRPENEGEASLFHKGMVSFSEACVPAFIEAYDFTQFDTIMDIGGGFGGIIRAILKECPKVKGVIAEMPDVVSGAKQAIAEDDLTSRCNVVPCDFFKNIPSGVDAYFMKHILHDWNDEDATCVLKNIRKVIPANGKLVLAEAVLPTDASPHPGKLLDIEMLVFLQGKERTESEWRDLLAGGGFTLTRVIPTKSPLHLIEAVPA